MDSMFFFLILVTILSYGLHAPLLAIFVRKINGLNVLVYRNLSFVIMMLPILFFTTITEIVKILDHIPTLILASMSAFISFWARLSSIRHIPLGLNSAINQVLFTIFAFALGIIFFGEMMSMYEIMVILIILIAATSLSVMKMERDHLKNSNVRVGIILAIISGIFHTLAFFFFAKLARDLNPYVATYFWESLTGIFALIFVLVFGGKFKVPKFELPPKKEIFQIALVSSLAIVGTLSFGLAVNLGNFTIVSGLMVTTVILHTIVSYFLFKERINFKQGIAMVIIIFGIIVFKSIL